jgi:CRP-like cAMP-binding protein
MCSGVIILLDQASVKNHLLRAFPETAFARLASMMVRVELHKGQDLVIPGQTIQHCWFIEHGVSSLVAMSSAGRETEAGIVGAEGMVDVATILGSDRSPLRCFIQIAGHGYRVPVNAVVALYEESLDVRTLLNRFAYDSFLQVAQTALANAAFNVNERLARWLLMCADRTGNDQIALTHELLAVMLNVRRAGVTQAMHALEQAGFVKNGRALITIVDRMGLENFARDSYAPLV